MKTSASTPWFFLAPNMIVIVLFTFVPIAINFYYAFTGGVNLYPSQRPGVGVENFSTLMDCGSYFDPSSCRKDVFWQSIWNTAKYAIFQVSLMVLFALITAIVLNRKIIGRGFWRGVFFYPVLLSPVVVALIWKWILQRDGLLNAAMVAVDAHPVLWLAEPGWAFFWVTFVSIWAHMGFYTLILLAGLQAIPADLYEAAQLDKASPWRSLTKITLPLLMPNLLVVVVLAMIKAVQIFDEVFVLTGGGPGSATTFVVQFIYQTGFVEPVRLYGIAAAGSLLLALALVALTLLQLKLSNAEKAGERAK